MTQVLWPVDINSFTADHPRSPNGGPYGFGSCVQAFVWREAFDGDRVCVREDRERVPSPTIFGALPPRSMRTLERSSPVRRISLNRAEADRRRVDLRRGPRRSRPATRLLTFPLPVYEHNGLMALRRVEMRHRFALFPAIRGTRRRISDTMKALLLMAACRPEFSVVARACSLRSVAGEA